MAVRSARAAFEQSWGRLPGRDRGRLLLAFAEQIRAHSDELVELESLDSGKPVSTIRRQDLPAVLDTLTYYAGWADKINGQVIPTRADALTYMVREPRWSRRRDRAVELSAHDRHVEDRAGTRLRLHSGTQAGGTDFTDRVAPGRACAGGRSPCRRAERCTRLRQNGRRGARRAPRCRQNYLHRLTRRGSPDPAGCSRQLQAGHARARRQVREHHLSPTPTSSGGEGGQLPESFSTADRCARPVRGFWRTNPSTTRWSNDSRARAGRFGSATRATRPRPWVRWCPPCKCNACSTISTSAGARARDWWRAVTGAASADTSSSRPCSRTSNTPCASRRRRSSVRSQPCCVQGRGGRDSDGQRHALQPRCRRLELGYRTRAPFCASSQGRNGVGQYFRPD